MAFESIIRNSVNGASLQITPTLITWNQVVCVFDDDALVNATDEDPSFALLEAYIANADGEIAQVGDPHAKYPDAYVQRTWFEPFMNNASTHYRQMVSYAQPGPYSMFQADTYQTTEERTFAEDSTNPPGSPTTNITTVEFGFGANTYAVGIGPTASGIPQGGVANPGNLMSKVPPVVQVRVPSKMRALRVTQYEALTGNDAVPSVIVDSARPFWNNDEIWGFSAGELLFIGVDSSTEGTPLFKRTYTYLINPYGWHHFYEIWRSANGLIDPTIIPIDPTKVSPKDKTVKLNGAAAFRMLPNQTFADRFTNIKKPFNTSFSAAEGAPDPQGDFNPMPGSFA